MQQQRIGTVALLIVLLAACAAERTGPTVPGTPAASAAPSASDLASRLPRCEDVPQVAAPEAWYRDSPIYVANEQPTEELRVWAERHPGFEGIWKDRDRLGWLTLAFSEDAVARQADLEEEFPDVGAVAVEVDWTSHGLSVLQQRLSENPDTSTWISIQQGVVGVNPGLLTQEAVDRIESLAGDGPVCIEGIDPADAPPPGPQPAGGEGWRLLADEAGVGATYRTGLAWDDASYERLWRLIGLSAERPPVDFETEIAVWFGAVYGSSCPDLRLDDVTISEQPDEAWPILHAVTVLLGAPSACTSDANPRAYVVAFERSRLPAGPFAIQLRADDPPNGAPEERTVVEADLSRPSAAPGPLDIHGDPNLGVPEPLSSGAIIEPGFPSPPYALDVSCGIEWLGEVNAVWWRVDGGDPAVPPEWEGALDGGTLILDLFIEMEPEPHIRATANGHTVVYRPTPDQGALCG